MSHQFDVTIQAQPDDITCGPTCLHAVYHYYDDIIDLKQVISEVHAFEGGGTLAVWLACHALNRGYDAQIFTYNLQMFDPTWFQDDSVNIAEKLKAQLDFKKDPKLILATQAYLEFFELGGKMRFEDLSRDLLRRYLKQNIPVLTGLNANFLYRSPREIGLINMADDVKGEPDGHFVILSGYDREKKIISIADPLNSNPYSSDRKYSVGIDRVICSILLGILTYDANFLIIRPKKKSNGNPTPTIF